MKSTFEVNGKEFKIVYSMLGRERYLYDGKVIRSGWSLKAKSIEVFDIAGDDLKIDNSASFKDFSSKAYVNGELIVEDLFPEVTNRYLNRNKRSWKKALTSMTISCAATILIISLYNTYG